MKKTVCMLLALLLAVLVPVSALAEASGEKTLEELLAERARLDEEINRLQRDETILPGRDRRAEGILEADVSILRIWRRLSRNSERASVLYR